MAKPIWILLKQQTVSGNGISWAICKSAPSSRHRQTTTAALNHSTFYRLDALPAAQPTVSKHWREPHNTLLCINFASAAVTVDSSHMTVPSSVLWSRFSPPSNFVNRHVSTMWFMVCRWPQSQEGDWSRPHLCKLARHGPWPVHHSVNAINKLVLRVQTQPEYGWQPRHHINMDTDKLRQWLAQTQPEIEKMYFTFSQTKKTRSQCLHRCAHM